MHYIVGTEVLVTEQKVNPRDPRTYKTRRTASDFKPGMLYSLYHIRKDKDDKMRYVFLSNDQTDVVGLIFNTISEADKYIAAVKRENLPDYNDIYSRNTS